MAHIVIALLNNWSDGKTSINLPSTLTLHPYLDALIFLGYIEPENHDWSYSYGEISFYMNREQFDRLCALAKEKKVCFAHT